MNEWIAAIPLWKLLILVPTLGIGLNCLTIIVCDYVVFCRKGMPYAD